MLTSREYEILSIIGKSEKSIIASDIVKENDDSKLTINTVQAVLKKLLKEELIEIGEIVYSGTVLCRAYKVSDKAPKIIAKMLVEELGKYEMFVSKDMLLEELSKSE